MMTDCMLFVCEMRAASVGTVFSVGVAEILLDQGYSGIAKAVKAVTVEVGKGSTEERPEVSSLVTILCENCY